MTDFLDIWKILGVISIILLIIYWRKRNAVWGGLAIGIVVGFLVVIFSVFMGSGFNWFTISKVAILGTIMGFVAELLGRVSDISDTFKKGRHL